jgi:hypothetical protein
MSIRSSLASRTMRITHQYPIRNALQDAGFCYLIEDWTRMECTVAYYHPMRMMTAPLSPSSSTTKTPHEDSKLGALRAKFFSHHPLFWILNVSDMPGVDENKLMGTLDWLEMP